MDCNELFLIYHRIGGRIIIENEVDLSQVNGDGSSFTQNIKCKLLQPIIFNKDIFESNKELNKKNKVICEIHMDNDIKTQEVNVKYFYKYE